MSAITITKQTRKLQTGFRVGDYVNQPTATKTETAGGGHGHER